MISHPGINLSGFIPTSSSSFLRNRSTLRFTLYNHCDFISPKQRQPSMEAHREAVQAISSRIASFYETKTPFRMYHGSTNTTQRRKVDRKRVVDTSGLRHVFEIDRKSMTCLVEPNVAMDELVRATLPHGLLPPVVMEFPGITVGGSYAGTASESSGFKYGFFDSIVNSIEIVLANGEIVKTSRSENSDLFHGAAGSFGTLGVVTLLEIELVKAKRYVELTYHPIHSIAESLEVMDAVTLEANDYVDGIMFSPSHGVIVAGRLKDDCPGVKIQRFSRAQDPWFYIHAERATRHALEAVKFAVPVEDYLFRFDRGAFWTGTIAFQYFLMPFNRITRYLLDYFLHTRVMYQALHESGHASKYIVQDLLLPRSGVQPFVEFVDRNFGIWPLWLCPIKPPKFLSLYPKLGSDVHSDQAVSFVNIGVWGPGSTIYSRFVEQNRRIEAKLRELGGIKWLYAQAFYTEDEFWSIYDRKWYTELREKWKATHLPDVYHKVRADLGSVKTGTDSLTAWLKGIAWRTWPVSGLYGVAKVLPWLSNREYLIAK